MHFTKDSKDIASLQKEVARLESELKDKAEEVKVWARRCHNNDRYKKYKINF